MTRLARKPVAIFHMSSFSRSGETVMQRVLNAHPDIEIVHHLYAKDRWRDILLVRMLQRREATTIPAWHPLLWHRTLNPNSVLLLKNATWTHSYPYRGFILVRNPIAVCTPVARSRRNKRLSRQHLRWARGIDPTLQPDLNDLKPLKMHCELLTRKFAAAHATGLPIVHYERFVRDPETMLRKLIAHLGLDWDPAVLTSETGYPKGLIGHGNNPLWLPLHTGSLDKYLKVDMNRRQTIYSMTKPLFDLYGYQYDDGVVTLPDSVDDRF